MEFEKLMTEIKGFRQASDSPRANLHAEVCVYVRVTHALQACLLSKSLAAMMQCKGMAGVVQCLMKLAMSCCEQAPCSGCMVVQAGR